MTVPPLRLPPKAGGRRGRTAHDATMDAIGRAIVNGRYPEGSILPSKEELMDQLDVSLTTLREAMQTVTAKGMLSARARVGTRVSPRANWNMFDADVLAWHEEVGLTTGFLASLLEMRQTIEPAAAALAAVRRTDEEAGRLRDLATLLDVDKADRGSFVEADVAFHQCILQASGNPFMQSISAMIGTALSATLALSAPRPQSQAGRTVQEQHAAIADAVLARDPQAASDAMSVVIREGWLRNEGFEADPVASMKVAPFVRR